ncbi:Rna-directed dna polymerase from mobile element jockey-like protein, partial [Caligus rogercresseyi]
PVCILPALSKILETVVKTDFEIHLAKTEALPNTQFGFRRGRSTTTALATAHAKWLKAEQRGRVVGVLGFDLSAAFDTVDQLQLLPKLKKLGIEGMQLEWFKSYLSGGSQRVVWNGAESDFLNVKYGVRQGSILGPILYLVLVADVTSCVGIGDEENSS